MITIIIGEEAGIPDLNWNLGHTPPTVCPDFVEVRRSQPLGQSAIAIKNLRIKYEERLVLTTTIHVCS